MKIIYIAALLALLALLAVISLYPTRYADESDHTIGKIAASMSPAHLTLYIEALTAKDEVEPAAAVLQLSCAYSEFMLNGDYYKCLTMTECYVDARPTHEGYSLANAFNSCWTVLPVHYKE